MKKPEQDNGIRLSEAASNLNSSLKSKFEKSGAKDFVDQALGAGNDLLKKTRISETASQISESVNNELDSISGKKIMEKLTAHIVLQEQYNDVLAGKLEETLNRVEELEKKIRGH